MERGGVQIIKRDKEMKKSEALGGANLKDIVMTIKRVKSGEDVGKITVHWNEEKKAYTAETLSDGEGWNGTNKCRRGRDRSGRKTL